MKFRISLVALALTTSSAAHAMTDAELATVVDKRLVGDRTGACFAVAVVERDQVARAFRCADPADAGRIGPEVAFEIGSVTKTMAAALLADLIVAGEASLDDPLADWLPAGTRVPDYQGQPIRLRHLVTHTSGLPRLAPNMPLVATPDPYASWDGDAALAALSNLTLTQPPGSRLEYSNFGAALLSYALAHRTGTDFATLLDKRLFTPLGMEGAFLHDAPAGVRLATGHTAGGQPTPPWTFERNLEGVGGVRATLDDMVAYVQAHLGARPSRLDDALALSRQPLDVPGEQPMAMCWLLAPLDGRTLHLYEGVTGGFSSFVGLDGERGRGVVVLSDTEQLSLGGLGKFGLHLIDPRLGEARPSLPHS